MFGRIGIVILAALVSTAANSAEDICATISHDIGADLGDRALFIRPDPIRNDTAPKWRPVLGLLTGADAPRGRSATIAYVIYPLKERSGVINVRTKTEAIGSSKDTATITIDRSQFSEPCGFLGRKIARGNYAANVRTLAYEEYHQIGKSMTAIDRFHFTYRRDDATCLRTDASERRTSFRLAQFEAGFVRPVRVEGLSNAEGLAQEIAIGIVKVATAPIKLLTGTAHAAVNPSGNPLQDLGSELQQKYYSRLQSILRRYHAKPNTPACVTFPIRTHEEDRSTYISITDFDDSSSNTWQVNWITN